MRRRSCGRPSTLGEQAARFFRPGARSDNRRALPAQSAARARDDRHRWAHRARNCGADRRPGRIAVVPGASPPRHRPRPDEHVPRRRVRRRDLPQRHRAGEVSRRAAYVRYNGLLGTVPSFTIMSSRCTHVGCPTQPNGPTLPNPAAIAPARGDVTIVPTRPPASAVPATAASSTRRATGPQDPRHARSTGTSSRSATAGSSSAGSTASAASGDRRRRADPRYALQGAGQPLTGAESWFYPIAHVISHTDNP